MICFKDMTFCSSKTCGNREGCHRDLTPELQEQAAKWWEGMEGEAPIAFSDFTNHCAYYANKTWSIH